MNAEQLNAFLKAAKDVPLLQAGGLYATGAIVSPYPVKEHHDLVTTKTIYTPLETILTARAAKSDAKDPATKALFDSYKKSADTLTFRGHRNAPVAKVEWDDYYVFMKALVIEHPKLLLAENKGFNKTLSKLYRASSDFIGNASLTVEQQSTLKTRSLCLPLVSDNPWQKGAQEADEIEKVVLEDMGLQTAPQQGAHDHHKFVNTTTQYEKQIAYLRELLNHTFLRAVYHTSTKQARLEYKQVQETFLNQNARRAANNIQLFTAQNIIDYIEANCVTDNDKTIVQITNAFNDMIRHKGQALLNWLQSFAPLMTKYRRAYGLGNALDDAALKKLWKLHFVKQINMTEQQLLLNFKRAHLNQNELTKISTLADGVFDVATMTKLLTKLGASLEYYEPDAMVKSYLYQHAQSLGWDRDKLNFRNPKERDSKQRGDPRSSKRKPPNSKRDGTDPKTKRLKPTPQSVPAHDQCKRKACREKGTYINHTHKDCRFKSSDRTKPPSSERRRQGGTRHPNLGQAPPKKTRTPKPAENKPSSAPTTETRTCYICNKPGHIAPNCPDKANNKQKAQSKLFKNKNFMVLWQESWDDQDEQACATRVVEAWGDDNLCPMCHKDFTFNHRCDPEDKRINKHFDTVKSKLRQSPLLKLIREAHEGTDEESSSTDNVLPFSMNHSFFVGEDEGQQDDNLEYNQDHSDSNEAYTPSQSDSHSDAESAHESRDYVASDNDSDGGSHHSDSSAPF